MHLFNINIDYDCESKKQNIIRELEFFYEREFFEKSVDDLVSEWYEIYKYKELPIIKFDEPYLEDEQIVGRDRTSLKIYIPLDGYVDSLKYEPQRQSLWGVNYLTEIDEKNNRLFMELIFNNKSDIDVDLMIEETVLKRRTNIESQYKYLQSEISFCNNLLFNFLNREFEKLYEKVKTKIEIENKTKKSKYLRVEPKPTLPIKIAEKTIETKDIKNSVVNQSFERVKVLEKESYMEIYNNLLELSTYAKRLPRSYNKLSEEENRDQLINALNLKLKTATASGETFNVNGKSDIIIVDNKVIYYIAECKIWNGASKFKDAIDQLLSYISEDVFYSSLIIFNKNMSSIVDTAVDKIKEHSKYIEEESKNRYLFRHPKNEKEKLEISLIVFDVYYE